MHATHLVAHPPFREGTGTACYYNALALRELGCSVTVYAPAWKLNQDERRLKGYRFMRCWLAIENAFLTPEILSIKGTDLLHLHFPFIFGAELVLTRFRDRVPLVVTYHNDLIGGGIRRPAFHVYNRLFAPALLRRAAKITVTSLDHADSAVYGETLFRERRADLVEIGNGVDTDAFRPGVDGSAVRLRHDVRGDQPLLMFVGHLDRAHVRKGLPELLETLALPRLKEFRLLVVGDGEMRSKYEGHARSLGLAERVTFVGRIPHADLPPHYAAADIVVVPSRPPESFGLALAEGMASGRPVIASNIPGVRTVVADGETGFLIEPGDRSALAERIEVLGRDTDLRRAMGDAGRQRALTNYSWRTVGERLKALYDELLS